MNIFGFNRTLRLQKEKYLKLSEALKTREKFWAEFHKDWPTWQSILKEMVEKDLEEIMKEKKIVKVDIVNGRVIHHDTGAEISAKELRNPKYDYRLSAVDRTAGEKTTEEMYKEWEDLKVKLENDQFAPVNSHLAAERIHTEFKNAMVSPSGVKDLRKQVVLLKEEGLTEALDNINDKRNKLAQDITDLVNKFEKETEFNATVCHQKNIFLVSGSLGTAAQKRFKMSTNSNFVNQITVEISI